MRHAAVLLAVFAASGITVADPPKGGAHVTDFTGRFEAATVRIRPQVSGHLTQIMVADGAAVKKGDVLAEIDPRPYQAEAHKAEALLVMAEAKAKLAAVTLNRAKNLGEKNAVSREELDGAEVAVQVAHAEIAVAKATREAAALRLSWTRVVSPADGRVGRFAVAAGERVTADDPQPLTTVVSTNVMTAAFDVDERTFLKWRRAGMAGPGNVCVALGLLDEEGFPRAAELGPIDAAVDAKTGTVRFRAACPNPDGLISPGMFVRARVTLPAKN